MSKTKKASKAEEPSRFERLSVAANTYGERSFDNYAQIRSVAERIQKKLCNYLDGGRQQCTFLVPPQGPFAQQDYGSGAYSVSGKGFLPLEPISFGLAVKVSKSGDFMRLVLHCRKEGDRIFVQVQDDKTYDFDLPMIDKDVDHCLDGLYQYLLDWFEGRVQKYDHGDYGSSDIGFDIQRIDTNA